MDGRENPAARSRIWNVKDALFVGPIDPVKTESVQIVEPCGLRSGRHTLRRGGSNLVIGGGIVWNCVRFSIHRLRISLDLMKELDQRGIRVTENSCVRLDGEKQ